MKHLQPLWHGIRCAACLLPFCWTGVALCAGADEQEVYAVVHELGPDGRKGRRLYLETFYLAPSEKRSARLNACGVDIFNESDKVDRLLEQHRGGHLVIIYRSTVDRATRNTRREKICRLGE